MVSLSSPRVLVVAADLDQTADLVVAELHRREIPVMRFDLAQFPQSLRMVAENHGSWDGCLDDGRRIARLEHVRSIHRRRPGRPVVAEAMRSPYDDWARDQAMGGLMGVLYALPAVWVNRPEIDGIASHKPVQLPTAAACGLSVPRSIITNDLIAARRFAEAIRGPLICKPVIGGQLRHDDDRRTGVPTHRIEASDLDESIELTAHYLQEWVPKQFEVRLIVVGDRFFAVTIHTDSVDGKVDWRTDYDALSYRVTETPEDVRAGVTNWMKRFGLNFGAFDFSVTPSGQWVMFECNPAGQWAWLQERTGSPICEALVDQLAAAA